MKFPNFIEKYSSRPLLTPENLYKHKKFPTRVKPPKTIIFCFNYASFNKIVKKFRNMKIDNFFGDLRLIKNYDLGIIGKFGIGSPITAVLVEELSYWGVKNIISIGMGSSLQKFIEIGDLVLVEKALRDEGTSYHYQPASRFADSSKLLQVKFKRYFNKKDIKYHMGSIWTTDAIYRETEAEVKYYSSNNILAIDMESSSLFTVASYCKVDAITILCTSDSVSNFKWEFNNYKYKELSNYISNLIIDLFEFINDEL